MGEARRRVSRLERLHWRIYLAVLASVATVVLLAEGPAGKEVP